MRNILYTHAIGISLLFCAPCVAQTTASAGKPPPPAANPSFYHEQYRPQFHFSPREKWMNDPNGLVKFDGVYHLFFQYYPDDIVWGPMHWGHATSRDLVHWQQQPIALYPDSLGYIFSGSAVVDSNNTSGLGTRKNFPLVAVFTHHNPVGEKNHANDFQNQSLAYSLDKGVTWTKYPGNPVLKNPGITDFRDPSVSWYAKGKKWVMALATKDRITFYSSTDLKNWTKESEFGQGLGRMAGYGSVPISFRLYEWSMNMRRPTGYCSSAITPVARTAGRGRNILSGSGMGMCSNPWMPSPGGSIMVPMTMPASPGTTRGAVVFSWAG
jgi:sucrose-6-phosphate hydrolase SacC (GH32 family)